MLLAIEFGENLLRGAVASRSQYQEFLRGDRSKNLNGLLSTLCTVPLSSHERLQENQLLGALTELVGGLIDADDRPEGIGISAPGIISYHGDKVVHAPRHLDVLQSGGWKEALEKKYSCPVFIINHADAAMIGLSELGYLSGDRMIGVMVTGTPPGFGVWRNGRRWRPGGTQPVPGGTAAPNAGPAEGNIPPFTTGLQSLPERGYVDHVSALIASAAVIYNLDTVYIPPGEQQDIRNITGTGGLENAISQRVGSILKDVQPAPGVIIAPESESLQLTGALAVIAGETASRKLTRIPEYSSIETEIPYDSRLPLHRKSSEELVEILWKAEEEAGKSLRGSLPLIAATAERVYRSLEKGGRLIYVGSGTSGRIAAMDAVEIPCTYGLPKDRALAVISGGVADASIDIEYNFEEDASSIPEMLLLNINPDDVVIGISASGSAYFVQSALAFARSRGAHAVMIRNNDPGNALSYCDVVIPLHSNHEVVAGSTRMKAGTATKKTLNFISSTAMIRLGKVRGSYMIDVACINAKLMKRAAKILRILYDVKEEEASALLQKNGLDLKRVIDQIEGTIAHQ